MRIDVEVELSGERLDDCLVEDRNVTGYTRRDQIAVNDKRLVDVAATGVGDVIPYFVHRSQAATFKDFRGNQELRSVADCCHGFSTVREVPYETHRVVVDTKILRRTASRYEQHVEIVRPYGSKRLR